MPLIPEANQLTFVYGLIVTTQETRRSGDHAHDTFFLNTALIDWLSKNQSTSEGSVFGAEYVTMKTGVEALKGIRYKLCMMGVPLTGPTYVYGDNMSVIYNTSRPESTLKKKSNSICYHAVREAVASGELLPHIAKLVIITLP